MTTPPIPPDARASDRPTDRPPARPPDRLGRALHAATTALAVAGGALLIAAMLATVYSIVGRALPDVPALAWWRPIRGAYEAVEIATALAIFAFLPYAQITGAHVAVDLLASRASPRTRAGLGAAGGLLTAAVAALLAWRMALATAALLAAPFPQTTMLLRVPLAWAYLPATACMALFAATALYTAGRALRGDPRRAPPAGSA